MFDRKRLNAIFPTWASGGGIFSFLNDYDVPWKAENAQDDISPQLDIIYHGNQSGKKYISPMADALLDANNGEIDDTLREQLASAVYVINEMVWSKEWNTLFYEYDPISNYDAHETTTDTRETDFGKTHTQTNNLSHTKTGSETETPNVTTTRTDNTTQTDTKNLSNLRTDDTTQTDTKNLTDTRTDNTTQTDTKNLTDVSSNKIFGFNSSVGVDDSERTDTHTGTDTVTNTGTVTTTDTGTDTVTNTGTVTTTDTGTDTITNTGTVTTATTGTDQTTYNTTDADTGTIQGVEGGRDVETYRHTLDRSGNIGVTTSQQMIQSERELDMWNYFHEVVFPSIDKLLTTLVY